LIVSLYKCSKHQKQTFSYAIVLQCCGVVEKVTTQIREQWQQRFLKWKRNKRGWGGRVERKKGERTYLWQLWSPENCQFEVH
jgi:hypothetical protein